MLNSKNDKVIRTSSIKHSPRPNRLNASGTLLGDFVIHIIMIVVIIVTAYPMYQVFIVSISDPLLAASRDVYFVPKGLYFGAYKSLLTDSTLWRSYGYTVFYVTVTTLFVLITSITCAYPLSVKNLWGKRAVVIFLIVPMYFSGGLIPTFILVSRLGLYNTPWAIIFPVAFNIWYIILTRTYFMSLPETLRESAKIDGASQFTILWRIYIPLSKPIIAVVAIYSIVGVWNGWFGSMVYQPDVNIQPLQMYLRRILIQQQVDLTKISSAQEAEALARLRMARNQLENAIIIYATLPIIFVYPFFQKYFVKGVMLGSLKG